jgi:hypothetical protein
MAFAYCTSLEKITVPATTTIGGSNVFLGDTLTMYCHSGSSAATYASTNRIGTVLTYTVKFLSDTGTQLSSQEVVQGSAAVAPTLPDRPGYALTWSSDFSNVSSDLTVTAVYSRIYTVTFIDEYLDKTATAQVKPGKAATAPSWSLSGYTLKWSGSFSNVNGDMTVYATWKDPKTGYVIDGNTIKPADKGTQLTKGSGIYKVTSADPQNPTVAYSSCTKASPSAITVPSTITVDGVAYKVTALAAGAFMKNTSLTSVTIGANVKKIGAKAFANCTKLAKVTIKSKVLTSIGSKAFYNIKKKASVYAYRSKLTTYQKKIKSSGVKTTIKLKAIS